MMELLPIEMFDPPRLKAEWAPVFLEPMQDSGERITIAVVALAGDGASSVNLSVTPKVLRCMYGDQGAALFGIVKLVQDSLLGHLDSGASLQSWVSPVPNCFLGSSRVGLGVSLEEVARSAMRLTASLSTAVQAALEERDSPDDFGPEVDTLIKQVKESVRRSRQQLADRFAQEIVVKRGAMPTRIGYLGEKIAANFDVLMPGNGLSTRRARSKSRLLDLQVVRDRSDMFASVAACELMLWLPSQNTPMFDERSLAAARSVFSEIEEIGDKHEIRVRQISDADAAARVIVQAEA